VSRPPERIERRTDPDRERDRTIVIVSRSAGFFPKAVALIAAFLLLALAFVFSLLFFAILTAVVLVLLAYAWWVRRRAT